MVARALLGASPRGVAGPGTMVLPAGRETQRTAPPEAGEPQERTMKRFIAATFSLIGLALTSGAFAASAEVVAPAEACGELLPADPGLSAPIALFLPPHCSSNQRVVCTCTECHCEVLPVEL